MVIYVLSDVIYFQMNNYALYEVLASVAKKVKSRTFGTQVRKILKEEHNHLELCTKLAKQNIGK